VTLGRALLQFSLPFFASPAPAPACPRAVCGGCGGSVSPAPVPGGPSVKIGFAVSRGGLLAAVAGALGLTVSDVAQYLDAGHSLAELAAAHNVQRQTLREAILTEVRREIEAQV